MMETGQGQNADMKSGQPQQNSMESRKMQVNHMETWQRQNADMKSSQPQPNCMEIGNALHNNAADGQRLPDNPAPSLSSKETTAVLRKQLLQKRREIPADIRKEKNARIAAALYERISSFSHDLPILCFYPLWDEVDLRSLYERLWTEGRVLYFPVTDTAGNEIFFYAAESPEDFCEGAFHVMEPIHRKTQFQGETEYLAVTPGVVFSEEGGRVGFGKGYYDRFFTKYPHGHKIGVAFSEQMISNLIQNDWDVPVDEVLFF